MKKKKLNSMGTEQNDPYVSYKICNIIVLKDNYCVWLRFVRAVIPKDRKCNTAELDLLRDVISQYVVAKIFVAGPQLETVCDLSRLFAQPFIQGPDQRKYQAQRHWPLYWEFNGDRWIPRTKGK